MRFRKNQTLSQNSIAVHLHHLGTCLWLLNNRLNAPFRMVCSEMWWTQNKLLSAIFNKGLVAAELNLYLPAKVTSKKADSCYDAGIVVRFMKSSESITHDRFFFERSAKKIRCKRKLCYKFITIHCNVYDNFGVSFSLTSTATFERDIAINFVCNPSTPKGLLRISGKMPLALIWVKVNDLRVNAETGQSTRSN